MSKPDEELIHSMLDEMVDAGHISIGTHGKLSKYSIIEKYFKQIREDTKKECTKVTDGYFDEDEQPLSNRIKKL